MATSKGKSGSVICILGSLESSQFSSLQSDEAIEGMTSNHTHEYLDEGCAMYQEAVTHNTGSIADAGEQMISDSEDLKNEARTFGRNAFPSATCACELLQGSTDPNVLAYISACTAPRHKNQRVLPTVRQQSGIGVVSRQQTSDFCVTGSDTTVYTGNYYQDKLNASWSIGDNQNAVTSQSVRQPPFYPSWSPPHRVSPSSTTGE
jgi:hypothetical protein